MLRNFLPALFILLFLMGCVMCQAAAAKTAAVKEETPFVLFQPDTTKFKNGASENKQFQSFISPSLSYVKNVLLVVAQAKEKSDGKKCDIVEGYFKIEGDGSLSDKDGKDEVDPKWKKQITTNAEGKCAEDPAFAVNKTDIFLFFKNSGCTEDSDIGYCIKGGKFNEIEVKKEIAWESPEDLMKKQKLSLEQSNQITSVSSGGSGIVVNQTFVVPVWYTDSKKNNFVSVITNTSNTDSEKWELFLSTPPVEGKHPAIVEWRNKLIMLTTNEKGLRKVYESTGIKEQWTKAVGSLSAMWEHTDKDTLGKYNDRNNLITAVFDKEKKKEVMLFTKLAKKGDNYELHLWMSDYTRVSLA